MYLWKRLKMSNPTPPLAPTPTPLLDRVVATAPIQYPAGTKSGGGPIQHPAGGELAGSEAALEGRDLE